MKGYGQFCPVAKGAEVFAERWTPLVLRELLCGSTHFSDLHRGVPLMSRTLGLSGYRMGINYGVNRVRFPAPLPSGSRIRGRFTVQSVDEVEGGEQGVVLATIEREGGGKPVCVAELVLRMIR